MSTELLNELRAALASSRAGQRKRWADEIVEKPVPLTDLLPLLHAETRTAQRFTWLIGDVCERNSRSVQPVIRILFDLRDQVPFTGMPRTVAKCLMLMKIEVDFASEAVIQMLEWIRSQDACMASKNYSSHALFDQVKQGKLDADLFRQAMSTQLTSNNLSYVSRVRKMLERLEILVDSGKIGSAIESGDISSSE